MIGSEFVRKQSLFQGAFVLTVAGFATKILGFATTIIQSRIIGAEAIGLQMMVFPLIGLFTTITTLGLPVAISKSIAEAATIKDEAKIKRVLIVALTITCSIALILTSVLLYFGKSFSQKFLADQRAYYSLMALAPVIPIIAISSVLRGYFQGRQNMNPLAFSQVLEQVVRILLLYFLVQKLAEYGIEYAAAGAIIASVVGELASLLYLGSLFRFPSSTRKTSRMTQNKGIQYKNAALELFQTGLPQTGNQFFRSVLRVIQPPLITGSLLRTGLTASVIAQQFGMLTGYVYPLLFFPGFINYSLAVALVPAISSASAKKQVRLVNRRVSQAVKTSLLIGVPSCMVLFIYAEQILTLFYRAPEAAGLLKLTAPFFLFQYFHSPMQSSLIGIGHATTAMFNNIIPRCISLALIYPLTVYFDLGIYGVAMAASIAVVLETICHYIALYRQIGACFQISDIFKIISCGIVAAYFSYFTYTTILLYHAPIWLSTLIAIIALLFLYFPLVIITKVVLWKSIWVNFAKR